MMPRLFLLFAFMACGVSASQVESGAKLACTLVEAFQEGKVIDSICATAPELAGLAANVLAQREVTRDAGIPRGAISCRTIPTTEVCAVGYELAIAISHVKGRR